MHHRAAQVQVRAVALLSLPAHRPVAEPWRPAGGVMHMTTMNATAPLATSIPAPLPGSDAGSGPRRLTLHSQLPIRFRSGLTIRALDTPCRNCGVQISPTSLRGTVAHFATDRVVIDLAGTCQRCTATTIVHIRIDGHGRYARIHGHLWRTGHLKLPLMFRLRRTLSRWLSGRRAGKLGS